MKNLSVLLQDFFIEYLNNQRQTSRHTISSYRDTFCLLLKYTKEFYKKQPIKLKINDFDSTLILNFLNYLERNRGISARTRNQRLAAIRSFFRYISIFIPEYIDSINQILAIPDKRYEKKIINFLENSEIIALLNAPNRKKWIGRRDHLILMLMIQTGLRISELIQLKSQNINLCENPYVYCIGKGRKERTIPLTKEMKSALNDWLIECNHKPNNPLFSSSRGGELSSDTIQYLVSKYVKIAQLNCISLKKKKITPHVLRHTTAVSMLNAGIDRSMIALWLGHESIETTQIYLDSNLKMKEKILEKLIPIKCSSIRYKPDDDLLKFLSNL